MLALIAIVVSALACLWFLRRAFIFAGDVDAHVKAALDKVDPQGASGVSDEWFSELDERRARITKEVFTK
jgi:hypothetical protein